MALSTSLSSLCQRCGLCCDGNLFTHVPLQRAELPDARRLALGVVALADGSPALRQCCTALKGRQCTLYAERPESCRRYVCRLFTELSEGKRSFEEALAVVDQAQALLSALEASLGPELDTPPSSAIQRARLAELSERGAPLAEVHALRERAEAFLDRHFHGGPRSF